MWPTDHDQRLKTVSHLLVAESLRQFKFDCSVWARQLLVCRLCSVVLTSFWIRERPIQDLQPMSDDWCCYGNIHRYRYRCRCGLPGSPSDIITADHDHWSRMLHPVEGWTIIIVGWAKRKQTSRIDVLGRRVTFTSVVLYSEYTIISLETYLPKLGMLRRVVVRVLVLKSAAMQRN